MSKPPLPPELDRFLAQPNPAVIATLDRDGSPHSVATWYLWEDGRVLVNMDESRKRLHHLHRDPRVSITVMGRGDEWYRHATLRGRVMSIDRDPDLTDIDRISRHYTGNEYRMRDRRSVSAWIEVESWFGWNSGAAWTGSG